MTYTLEEVSVRVVSGLLGLAAGALLLVPTGNAPAIAAFLVYQLHILCQAQGTKGNTIGSIANAAPLTLGAKDIGGDWYRGEMDDATLWVG
jgi:hypothetical protein